MGELGVNDAALRKMVATSDDLADAIRSIDNGDVIRESDDGIVDSGPSIAAKKAAGYFEETVSVYVKYLEAHSKAIKETAEDFTSTDQVNASSFFSTQQKLV